MMKSEVPGFSEKASIKLGLLFSKFPLTPNQWTILSVLPAIIGFVSLAYWRRMDYALLSFAAAALIDGIDGGVARVTGSVTALGGYLDGMIDRVVEALLLFGLFFYGIPDYYLSAAFWIALLLFAGTVWTSFARAYAHHRGAVTDPDKLKRMGGILERPERLILVFLGMLASFWNPLYLTQAIALASLLALVTVFQRLLFVVRNAE